MDFATIQEVADSTSKRTIELAREQFLADLAAVERRLGGKVDTVQRDMGELRDEITKLAHQTARVEFVAASARRAHVLIVDDYPELLGAIAATLESAGMTVVRAETTIAAVEALSADPAIEVALVDVTMRKNGYLMLDYVHEHHPAIQVIMTSGREIDPVRARECGAFGFLAKPFDAAQSILAIERAAEFRRMKLAAGIR